MSLGDSGSGRAARDQRRAEEERQRQITEGVNRVKAIFDGGTYGTGYTAPESVQWDTRYVDQSGAPVIFGKPASVAPRMVGAGSDGRTRMVSGRAPGPRPPASALGGRTFYTGMETAQPQFDDAYFGDIGRTYLDYYLPQLTDQYERAKRATILSAPGTNSSAFSRNVGQLETDFNREKVALGERSKGAEADARRNVEQTRADLISAAEGGSAPDLVAERAIRSSQFLRQPPAYEPLGDLFARYATTYANQQIAREAGYEPRLTFGNTRRKAVTTVA